MVDLEPTSLAFAYAEREHNEDELRASIEANYLKDPLYVIKPMTQARLFRSALRVEKILGVRKLPKLAYAIERAYARGEAMEKFADEMQGECSREEATLRKTGVMWAEVPMEGEVDACYFSIDSIWRQTDQAQVLAVEKGIDPTRVFRNDKLYAEMIRRAYNPKELVDIPLRAVMNLNARDVLLHLSSVIPDLAQKELTPETIEALQKNLFEDSRVIDHLTQFTSARKSAFCAYAAYSLGRFWGFAGLTHLPLEAQIQLQAAALK